MLKLRIGSHVATCAMTQEELTERVAQLSSSIKVVLGIINNAAYSACLEAIDNIRKHRNYRHGVKRAFNDALVEFKKYEHQLIYSEENRLFRLDDLIPEQRKRYGDISDREYYEFWCATGASAYSQNRKWVTNLWNKFRLSSINHDVPDAGTVAWAMTANACLLLAVSTHENWMRVGTEDYGIPSLLLTKIFGQLSLAKVERQWNKASSMLEPLTDTYELTTLEQKNIQLGVDQLQDELASLAAIHNGMKESIEAYSEVFRTPGEQKKTLRQVEEMLQQ